jgi:site-specific recombinase XerD
MANKGPKRSSPKTPKRRNGDSTLGTTDEHERDKDFLSEQEVETLRKAARAGRYGERDDCLVLMLYRHGLRVSEVAELRIKDLDLKTLVYGFDA